MEFMKSIKTKRIEFHIPLKPLNVLNVVFTNTALNVLKPLNVDILMRDNLIPLSL